MSFIFGLIVGSVSSVPVSGSGLVVSDSCCVLTTPSDFDPRRGDDLHIDNRTKVKEACSCWLASQNNIDKIDMIPVYNFTMSVIKYYKLFNITYDFFYFNCGILYLNFF